MTASTYTRKIGQNRGKPRLWLEGAIRVLRKLRAPFPEDTVRLVSINA